MSNLVVIDIATLENLIEKAVARAIKPTETTHPAMTSPEAARYLCVSLATLLSLRNRGLIPYSQNIVRGRVTFRREDLDKYIKENIKK